MSSHRGDPPRRLQLGPTGVRALAAFAVAVAVLAGVLAWRARPHVEPLAPSDPGSAVPSTTAAPASYLVVAISGKVNRPGLVRLPAGARVADAIDAAGGALPGTDLSSVNLARKVSDGELIAIGIPAPPAAIGAAGPAGAGAGPVNVNTATLDQLQTLPGVGPVLAQRIVDFRDQHGGFKAVTDLQKVSGIGDAKYNDLKGRVTV